MAVKLAACCYVLACYNRKSTGGSIFLKKLYVSETVEFGMEGDAEGDREKRETERRKPERKRAALTKAEGRTAGHRPDGPLP